MVIGFTEGVYDMFHVGHLNLIEESKKRCDYLIVGVHSDEIVEGYKHRKTVINEVDRCRIIAALKAVDKAVINRTRDNLELFKLYGFNKIFIGDDWKGSERWNYSEKVLAEVGVEVVYLPYTQGISTTLIRQKLGESCDAKEFKA